MYICTYIDNKKLSPTFLWVSKFDVKLGVGVHHFQNYPMYVSFQIFGSKSRLFFFSFLMKFSHFFQNLKNVIYHLKLKCKVHFWNQIFENSRECCNFENNVTPPPTWHQILKPIRMSLTIFISCISRYIPYLYTHKVWRKLKDTFDYRPIPSHPIK